MQKGGTGRHAWTVHIVRITFNLESRACLVVFHTDLGNMFAYALSPLQGGRSHLVHISLM